jgi:hypothetical protein
MSSSIVKNGQEGISEMNGYLFDFNTLNFGFVKDA